jgi:5-methyltetrahydropteroyltriglutamate--homocysteine methyltransferase
MSARTTPPFRADHVGSLLRPPQLLEARDKHARGEIDDNALREVEDAAIAEVVQLQKDVGLKSATDGEFRRASWHMDFIYQLGGVEQVMDSSLKVQFHNAQGDIEFAPPSMHVDARIKLEHTIFGDAFEYLKSHTSDGQTPKLTIPSPSMVHYRGGRASIDESVYADMDKFWDDLVTAYRDEVRRLGELGVTYLQFDDTSLAYLSASTYARSAGMQSTSTRSTSATSTRRSPSGPTG